MCPGIALLRFNIFGVLQCSWIWIFNLKSILSDISVATPAFLGYYCLKISIFFSLNFIYTNCIREEISISLPRFWKFVAIIALNIFSVPFYFSSPSRICKMWILLIFIVCYESWSLCLLFFFFFSFVFFVFPWLENLNTLCFSLPSLSSACLSLLLKVSIELFNDCIFQL